MAGSVPFLRTALATVGLLFLFSSSGLRGQTVEAWNKKGVKETLTLGKGKMYLILGHSMCHECVQYFRTYKKKDLAVLCLTEQDEPKKPQYTAAYAYFRNKFPIYTRQYGQICSTLPTPSRPADYFPQLLYIDDNGTAKLADYKILYAMTAAFTQPLRRP